MQTIQLGNIEIQVEHKAIRNVHLSVYPPHGRVRIAAPNHINLDTLRIYSISKLGWIKKQQEKFRKQKRETPRLFINRESHYFLGKRYMLKIIPTSGKHQLVKKVNQLEMYIQPDTTIENRQRLMDSFYRTHLKAIAAPLLKKWSNILKVKPNYVGIRKMTTKWGSCNEKTGRIWLNLELSKKSTEQIEYVLVHELVHLLERKHNDRFAKILNQHLPNWKVLKEELNGMGM